MKKVEFIKGVLYDLGKCDFIPDDIVRRYFKPYFTASVYTCTQSFTVEITVKIVPMNKVELKSFERDVWYRDDEVKLVPDHFEFFTHYKNTCDDMPWLCVKSITVEVTTKIVSKRRIVHYNSCNLQNATDRK